MILFEDPLRLSVTLPAALMPRPYLLLTVSELPADPLTVTSPLLPAPGAKLMAVELAWLPVSVLLPLSKMLVVPVPVVLSRRIDWEVPLSP
ncbi:hypothetical protein MMMDOFMJ_4609 [Methylobacterium gnaphalii]|nr:hypothetical protein MMMDOFMJ_4609 [Methylobacterium gnaphalii]